MTAAPEGGAEPGRPRAAVPGGEQPPPGRFARSRLSVQGWVRLILALLVLVVCGCALVAGAFMVRANDRTDDLVDRIQPARSGAFQLQRALLDQETGVRGYALTANPSFLAPYDQGRAEERRFVRGMRAVVAEDSVLATDLDRIVRAAERWRREDVAPLIGAVRARGAESASAQRLARSKAGFDELRTLFAEQQRHLDIARDRARAELDDARAQRDAASVAALGVFVTAVVVLALVLHRMVGRPLNALRAASDDVRAGAFDRRIETGGPSDLRAVGAAVEDMRRRLVAEISATQSREALLAEQADELRRSNSELEQFAYVASHDLQEPLRKVASFCQLLEKRYGDQLDARGKQYIDFAVDGAKRMQVLINDLLTFSRVGRVHDAWQDVDMGAALDRALGNLALVVEEAGATVVRESELPRITGDPTTLAMLWQNLVGNAVKFRRPEVPSRITVGCVRERAEGDGAEVWHVTVSDNGIGVAPEFAEKVFVIFQRLHGRDEYEGTGIGLALCRKIVEFHGGRIWLESPPEGGTRVHFTLPALLVPEEPGEDGEAAGTVAETAGTVTEAPGTVAAEKAPGPAGTVTLPPADGPAAPSATVPDPSDERPPTSPPGAAP
ncbi:CHASE3 domain-containing protein [Streptomyces hebeiensis]|uniref:histidine kinase n=1 Tax=Streptomyces hebeiensis TaxID=229486 RepID=A0ABN1V0I1_9ACTN